MTIKRRIILSLAILACQTSSLVFLVSGSLRVALVFAYLASGLMSLSLTAYNWDAARRERQDREDEAA